LNNSIKKFLNENQYSNFNTYVLGVDIGGTNINFGIAGLKNNKPELLFSLNFKTKEIESLIPALTLTLNYAKEKFNINISQTCIGASGLVSHNKDYAELTNISWNVDVEELINKTSLQSIFIINDFQAIGYGINLLNSNDKNDIFKVKDEITKTDSYKETKAVLGAGTGLGKSILIYNENIKAYVPIPSEGGHGDFPPQNDYELKLIEFIKELRNKSEPITYEELLSGRGLESIYLFLHNNKNEGTKYSNEIKNASDKAALISKFKDIDETCSETFRLFSKFYGRCAKNFVLDTLSTGGLYIAGGIASKNSEIFSSKEFIEEFESADKRREILKQTPIYVIVNYDVGLYGACFAATLRTIEEKL